MHNSPTQAAARGDLQILRMRLPPVTYLHQLCDLLATEGITLDILELRAQLELLPAKDRLILAVEGDQLIGYAHVRIVYNLQRGIAAEVASILVQPRRRRQGFGRRIIAASETWARQAQLAHLLLSSDVIRTAGHAFFTALGYELDSTKLEFIRQLSD